jgi:hypothetical protein
MNAPGFMPPYSHRLSFASNSNQGTNVILLTRIMASLGAAAFAINYSSKPLNFALLDSEYLYLYFWLNMVRFETWIM